MSILLNIIHTVQDVLLLDGILVQSDLIDGGQMLSECSLHQMFWYLWYVSHVPQQLEDGLNWLHLLGVDGLLSNLPNEEQQLLPDPIIGLEPLILDKFVQKLELLQTKLARSGSYNAVDVILDILPLKYQTFSC